MFLLFVNDMPSCVKSGLKLFADDAKLYTGAGTALGRDQLQSDLDALAAWSRKWMLPFNTAKCTILHLGSRNERATYTIHDVALRQSEVEKDLGVHMDSLLKFRKQAAGATSKGNRILGLIRHSFSHIDAKTLPLLYKTLVRPHLEYGNQVWGPFNMADKRLVERVQRRATKLVPTIRHLSYEERLRALKLPSLQYRRRRGDMITMYNIMHERVNLDKEELFAAPPTARTRGHPLKVAKLQAFTRVRCNHFSVRVVNDWNSLPEAVVCSPSLDSFKNNLDKHWLGYAYVAPA